MPVTEPEKAGTSSRGARYEIGSRIAHRGIDDSGKLRIWPNWSELSPIYPGFHIHVHVCIHTYMYVCMYMYMYIHTLHDMYACMYVQWNSLCSRHSLNALPA